MKRISGILLACLSACGASQVPGAQQANDGSTSRLPLTPKSLELELGERASQAEFTPIVELLEQELSRSMAQLKTLTPHPYFLGYQVVDRDVLTIQASHGALVATTHDRSRTLDVDLRLGSSERDHTHRLPGEGRASFKSLHTLPLAGGPQAVRNTLWVATDREYDAALARWLRVQSLNADEEAPEAAKADFSEEEPVSHAAPVLLTSIDTGSLEARLRKLSSVARAFPSVQRSSAALSILTENRYLVNTEGTRLQVPHRTVRLELHAQTVAEDGMVLERYDSVDVRAVEQIPNEAALVQRFRSLFVDVQALAAAKVIEPYVGPAILDGRAAGVFFHEVFGHRIEGHRQDDETEGQTFADMVGQQIMPRGLNIYDDPNVLRLNGTELNGFYLFDDEGVPAQKATLVTDGVLDGFLLSRTPARQFMKSNGHGRREPGHVVVARQANLIVDPVETVSRPTLVSALLAEVQRQGLSYGLRFSEISGGFTQTQRYDTQAFKVIPVMVYKVFLDGREELVRGVDIEGTPLTALSKIAAMANDFQVFNGVCGAESGWVPVSATSPSVLLSQIEVARQEQSDAKTPVLPPPPTPVTPEGQP